MPARGEPTQGGAGRDLAGAVDRARERVTSAASQAREAIGTADDAFVETVKRHPLLVLGIAVGVGYVIGRAVSRLS